MAKRKKLLEDNREITNAIPIANSLQTAAALLTGAGAQLGDYHDYLAEGMLRHAWEELRDAATDHSVPFAFWTEMSRAADLIGAPF